MKLLLVDGSNLILRHGFAQLRDLQIEHPEEAITGVLRSAEHALRECASFTGSSHAVIALDSEGASWRRDIFDGYKRGRQKISFPWSERFAQHLTANGWHCVKIEGQEADDILASLSARAVDKGITVSILSGDSDLLQVIGPSCHVYSFGTNSEPRFCRRDEGYLLQRYGVRNGAQLAIWKALVGEPGDGLPGVAKIGKVKAAKLIQKYPTVEAMRGFGALRSYEREQFNRMLALVELREDVPLEPIMPSACVIRKPEAPP